MLKMTDITFISHTPGPQKGSKSAVLFGCFYCHSFYPAYFDIKRKEQISFVEVYGWLVGWLVGCSNAVSSLRGINTQVIVYINTSVC